MFHVLCVCGFSVWDVGLLWLVWHWVYDLMMIKLVGLSFLWFVEFAVCGVCLQGFEMLVCLVARYGCCSRVPA